MKTKVWEVKMGNSEYPGVITDIKNVIAATLIYAINKAERSEIEIFAQMSKDEGEDLTPDTAVAVRLLCELDDD